MKFAILATGPSMSQAVADSVRDLRVIAVSDAFRLAPWAEAMAAQDVQWWRVNKDAHEFAGRKFSVNNIGGKVERIKSGLIGTSSSSGVLALEVAKSLGATDIELHGFDMHGSHYFGPHVGKLKNTTDARFQCFQVQFNKWGKANPAIRVINKTPGSALRAFPHG